MEYFVQQLINGLTLGSIYGLIAIGYTMVYGIIGMINFAHGDIFMVGAFLALIGLILVGVTAATPILLLSRGAPRRPHRRDGASPRSGAGRSSGVAYRPLRGSFRLAPLITAIGMSIVLQNFVQIVQGARVKPLPPIVTGGYRAPRERRLRRPDLQHPDHHHRHHGRADDGLLADHRADRRSAAPSAPASRTRGWRRCSASMSTGRSRSPSSSAPALAAVAGMMFLLYYGVIDFYIGFNAGIKAFTAAVLGGIGSLPGAMLGGLLIGLIEIFWSAYFSVEYKDVAAFSILAITLIFLPSGLLGRPEVEKV